jgi:hypothetical protein
MSGGDYRVADITLADFGRKELKIAEVRRRQRRAARVEKAPRAREGAGGSPSFPPSTRRTFAAARGQ